MAAMSSEYIIILEPGREGMPDNHTPQEQEILREHFEYLKSLTDRGVAVIAGHTTEAPVMGIVVFRADDRPAADAIMSSDPAIDKGVLKGRLADFRIALLQGHG